MSWPRALSSIFTPISPSENLLTCIAPSSMPSSRAIFAANSGLAFPVKTRRVLVCIRSLLAIGPVIAQISPHWAMFLWRAKQGKALPLFSLVCSSSAYPYMRQFSRKTRIGCLLREHETQKISFIESTLFRGVLLLPFAGFAPPIVRRPPLLHDLMRAGNGQSIGGHVGRDHRAGRDKGTLADLHRCHQRGVGTHKSARADLRAVFLKAIVVTSYGACTDIGSLPYLRIAKIGEMRCLGTWAKQGVFEFHKVAYTHPYP